MCNEKSNVLLRSATCRSKDQICSTFAGVNFFFLRRVFIDSPNVRLVSFFYFEFFYCEFSITMKLFSNDHRRVFNDFSFRFVFDGFSIHTVLSSWMDVL